MFKRISNMIIQWPVKVIAVALITTIVFVTGAVGVRLATGNETLLDEKREVFQDNLLYEAQFGGESIVAIFEANDVAALLTPENMKIIYELENMLGQYEEIYTIVNPTSVLIQIATKQYEMYQTGISDVAEGLSVMGDKLLDIGSTIQAPNSSNIVLPDMDSIMMELNKAFGNMIDAQTKLGEGSLNLVNGYGAFSQQLAEVSKSLIMLGNGLNDQQNQQIKQVSTQLLQLSEKMSTIAQNSAALPTIPNNTINGLQGIQKNLSAKFGSLDDAKNSQKNQVAQMSTLGNGLYTMGENLSIISENLNTMVNHFDAFGPVIPTSQATLDKMVYDENGELRVMLQELITEDKYLKFIVKLNGNVSDDAKHEITASIKEFLERNPMDSVSVLVSGKPVLDLAIKSSMKSSMQSMMGLSVLFMVIVLLLTFRVKWSLLPLLTILIVVAGTVGIMGWLNIPVTMVSMAVFPILIGLGIDYSIQYQSRYVEEMEDK